MTNQDQMWMPTQDECSRGRDVMHKTTFDENEENFLVHEIPDEALELLAYTRMQTSPLTQWPCTAVFFCPGP
jgi:hypothetical protein